MKTVSLIAVVLLSAASVVYAIEGNDVICSGIFVNIPEEDINVSDGKALGGKLVIKDLANACKCSIKVEFTPAKDDIQSLECMDDSNKKWVYDKEKKAMIQQA